MGTNYYYEYNRCDCCHRHDRLHIGKSSAGWTFSFQGTEEIRSYTNWLHFFENNPGEIVNEYGETIMLEAFQALVEAKRDSRHNHAREYPKGNCNWLDPEGHSFSGYDFS